MGYLFKNVLLRFCNLAKYHESKTKRHRPKILCGNQKKDKDKTKQAEAENKMCVGQEFSRTAIENPNSRRVTPQ